MQLRHSSRKAFHGVNQNTVRVKKEIYFCELCCQKETSCSPVSWICRNLYPLILYIFRSSRFFWFARQSSQYFARSVMTVELYKLELLLRVHDKCRFSGRSHLSPTVTCIEDFIDEKSLERFYISFLFIGVVSYFTD